MDDGTRQKWDTTSRVFDLLAFAEERRFGPHKRRLLSKMHGTTLMVAAGTGNDFQHFPPDQQITAIDISPRMLERAAKKAASYSGSIELRELDVCALPFPDDNFDTVATVCTFCSVPRPIAGLRELYRVLKPGGQLLMFEHVRSKIGVLGILLDLMTQLSRHFGPDFNRDTSSNVLKAGFAIRLEENIYLDIVKIIEGVKEPAS